MLILKRWPGLRIRIHYSLNGTGSGSGISKKIGSESWVSWCQIFTKKFKSFSFFHHFQLFWTADKELVFSVFSLENKIIKSEKDRFWGYCLILLGKIWRQSEHLDASSISIEKDPFWVRNPACDYTSCKSTAPIRVGILFIFYGRTHMALTNSPPLPLVAAKTGIDNLNKQNTPSSPQV